MLLTDKIYSLLSQILASVFSFAIILISSRILNQNDLGILTMFIMIVLLITIFPQSFVTMPILSNSAKETNLNIYFINNFIILILFIVITIIVFLILYDLNFLNIKNYLNFYSICMYFILFEIYEFIKRIAFVKNFYKRVTYYEFFKLTLFMFIILFYAKKNISINNILLSASFGYFIFILLFVFDVLNKIKSITIKYPELKRIVKENYNFGKWIFLSNIIQNINSNIYIYISSFLLPIYIIGILNAIRSLIGFSTVLFLAIDNYITPKYAVFYKNNNLFLLEKLAKKHFVNIGVILLIISFIISIFSKEILGFVYGKEFIKYYYFLYFFLLANFIMFFTRPFLIIAKTIGITKILFLSALPTLLFTLFFSYIIIDLFKEKGALLVMVITQMVHLLSLIYFYKKNKYFKRKDNE